MITAETSGLLRGIEGVRHAFFTRSGGVSTDVYSSLNCGLGSRDDSSNVMENRHRAAAFLDRPASSLRTLSQVHGTRVVTVGKETGIADRSLADGMVTNIRGSLLGILTADCAPLLFVDPDNDVIGAAHAGWRGALDGIVESTVEAMVSLGARRGSILAAIGPCITQGSYQVGEEFRDRFVAENAENGTFFLADNEEAKFLFDLPEFLISRLKTAEVGQYEWIPRCTYSEKDRFFSYRRMCHQGETDCGRGLSAIGLAL